MSCHLHTPIWEFDGSYALLSSDPSTDTAAIFVHGFWGNAWSTWEEFQTIADEDDVRQDFWRRTDLYFYEYRGASNLVVKSAQDFTSFVRAVYPAPIENLFCVTAAESGGVIPYDRSDPIRNPIGQYERLLLIGHSLGAVVLRKAIEMALRECKRNNLPEHALPMWVKAAQLCLFAPAHCGFRPSSWKALLLQLPILGSALTSIPALFRAYHDLQPTSDLIVKLQRRTSDLTAAYPQTSALRARNLFGEKEDIVEPSDFDGDIELRVIDGVGHQEICKPSAGFEEPLEFLTNALGPLAARA